MQLAHDFDRTEVEIHQTYRHAFDIHRYMGRQRVNGRPLFANRKNEKVKDGIVTTSRRQLTTKSRLDIFDCTGVPAQEYDLTLPCGIRREALPIRHNISTTCAPVLCQRERHIMTLRRKKDMEDLTRNREKADRKQHSAKLRRKSRGGGVRENMEKIKLIEHNKAKWLSMCKNREKHDTQRETEGDDKTNDTQEKNDKDERQDPNSSTLPGQRTHKNTRHKPLSTKHHGGTMEGDREGGGAGGKGPPSGVRDRIRKDGKNRIAKGRGSSAQERKMEEYYTRTPRIEKGKDENM